MAMFKVTWLFLAHLVASSLAFYNPIVSHGQDPSVKYYNGNYYLTQSRSDSIIVVMRSPKLENLGTPAENVTVFTSTSVPDLCCEFWAPELYYSDDTGLWYIYFGADDGNNANHRSYALQSAGSDPLGPYTFVGKIAATTDQWAIDGTVMKLNNQLYYIWSGNPYDVETVQWLYIATMSSPTSISSDRYVISEPDQDWEIASNGQGVNEGPAVLQANGKTWLAYSASGSWEDSYCLGLLTYNGGDPLQRSSWTKSDGCVFQGNPSKSVYGTGHNCFTTSPDGSEVWNLYGAYVEEGVGWADRSIRAQVVNFNSDGTPNLGTPVGFEDWVDPPSGE